MALEDIIAKINEDAQAQADEILAAAKKRAEEKLADAKERAERARETRLEHAEREAASAAGRKTAVAKLAARNALVAQRQAAVDRVYDEVIERLRGLDRDEYAKFIEKLLLARAGDGDEVMPAPADRGVITAALVERVSKQRVKEGATEPLKLAEDAADIKRGFVLRHGRIFNNCSLEALVSELRDDTESHVYAQLSGDDAGAEG